jgi:ADP-ribosyl-[dinitrogen reductase] hydrolase
MPADLHPAPWPGGRSADGGIDEVPLPVGPGRLWLCGKHVVGPDPDAAMQRVGATSVVCLNEEHELADRYPDYVAWLRANHAMWVPIPDLHAPSIPQARALVADLRAHVHAGERILMHCGAGKGRAGTMAAALLIDMGLPLEDALRVVGESRPLAGPEVGAQTELLRALARSRP